LEPSFVEVFPFFLSIVPFCDIFSQALVIDEYLEWIHENFIGRFNLKLLPLH